MAEACAGVRGSILPAQPGLNFPFILCVSGTVKPWQSSSMLITSMWSLSPASCIVLWCSQEHKWGQFCVCKPCTPQLTSASHTWVCTFPGTSRGAGLVAASPFSPAELSNPGEGGQFPSP